MATCCAAFILANVYTVQGQPEPPSVHVVPPQPPALAPAERESSQTLTAGIERTLAGMTFCWCPPGEFDMGSNDYWLKAEKPVHRVHITQGFWLGKYEVTQGQWEAAMGKAPSYFKGSDDLAVEGVSWNDCQEFVRKLSAEGQGTFRLPTEAEWEFACRAGSSAESCYGVSETALWQYPLHLVNSGRETYRGDVWSWLSSSCTRDVGGQYAWYCGNSGRKTHPVGQKTANAWGLCDMLGNVYEWCQDSYGNYPSGTVTDPPGPI